MSFQFLTVKLLWLVFCIDWHYMTIVSLVVLPLMSSMIPFRKFYRSLGPSVLSWLSHQSCMLWECYRLIIITGLIDFFWSLFVVVTTSSDNVSKPVLYIVSRPKYERAVIGKPWDGQNLSQSKPHSVDLILTTTIKDGADARKLFTGFVENVFVLYVNE